jgi:hypothetical protein
MQAQYGDNCLSRKEEFLYAMIRDQEDCQRQGLRPDLASSDLHKFGKMKEALSGRRFSSDEEAIGAVQNWLKTGPKNFF